MSVFRLNKTHRFPNPELSEPSGLLAIGGDLSGKRLITAYASGIFPWFNQDDPILWWSPDPRLILFPEKFKVSKSLRQVLNSQKFEIRTDTVFDQVIHQCKIMDRPDQDGTWITDEMEKAYIELYRLGIAHSVETFYLGNLVGGLYGLSLGNVFFGESMFHQMTGASKVAFYSLSRLALNRKFSFIDCQVTNPHLLSLGAEEIPRKEFLDLLKECLTHESRLGNWDFRF